MSSEFTHKEDESEEFVPNTMAQGIGQLSSQFAPKPAEAKESGQPTMAQKWKSSSKHWATSFKSAYLSNPAARRDFQVQFRGKGSIALFALVVLVFGGVSLYLFWDATKTGLGAAGIQEKLAIFCYIILSILGIAVTLVAPALASVSILVEKQRRSLDLVFTSPVKPLHYLFGKLIAGYRFVWILMALSLPFTAMSVIMGGGTWLNILEAYFLLSLQGLLFTAIGIYFSALVEKTLSALLYTYVTVIGFCFGAGALAMAAGQPDMMTPFHGGVQSFAASFVPVLVQLATGSYTLIAGIAVPNTLIAVVLTIGAVNYILRAAGGLLSPLRNKERRNLRIQTAGILAVATGAIGYYAPLLYHNQPQNFGLASIPLLGATLPLLLFLPFLASYAPDAEQRQTYAKPFRFGDLFGKSVAGALPYIYSLLGVSTLSYLAAGLANNAPFNWQTVSGIAYLFAFWTFAWSTARFASSFLNGIKAARTLQFLTLAAIVGTPLPLFVGLSRGRLDSGYLEALWQYYPFSPFLYGSSSGLVVFHTIFLSLLAFGLARWSEGNYQRRMEKRRAARMAEDAVMPLTGEIGKLSELVKDESLVQRLVQGN